MLKTTMRLRPLAASPRTRVPANARHDEQAQAFEAALQASREPAIVPAPRPAIAAPGPAPSGVIPALRPSAAAQRVQSRAAIDATAPPASWTFSLADPQGPLSRIHLRAEGAGWALQLTPTRAVRAAALAEHGERLRLRLDARGRAVHSLRIADPEEDEPR